ncbi:hypothetical protein BDU57DRAFT_316620 [Ampelomyces quisqualis]|uniref:Secreted protein n=1 Tax=Ampelomyces quisqualis TaxID=50730 RepID=A0A6A5QE08_AMPQU|nr:hypothetical protein BDU57DRAFT_316620 [Ampelomyces quisqualis]
MRRNNSLSLSLSRVLVITSAGVARTKSLGVWVVCLQRPGTRLCYRDLANRICSCSLREGSAGVINVRPRRRRTVAMANTWWQLWLQIRTVKINVELWAAVHG